MKKIEWILITLSLATSVSAQNTFPTSGNVGIGTSTPVGQFQVMGSTAWDGSGKYYFTNNASLFGKNNLILTGWLDSGNDGWSFGSIARNSIVFNINTSGIQGAVGTEKYSIQLEGNSESLEFLSTTQASSPIMVLTQTGNIGIGTASPGSTLEVNGNVKLTSGSGASLTFPDGTTQSTAWTGTLCGGDYAESVDAAENRALYQPGDVLVISRDATADVARSNRPYSKMVSGIYSTKPGMVGRRQQGKGNSPEVPMAMIGIVPTKVSAENGPIERGDLLVTSATEGYAMKGTD